MPGQSPSHPPYCPTAGPLPNHHDAGVWLRSAHHAHVQAERRGRQPGQHPALRAERRSGAPLPGQGPWCCTLRRETPVSSARGGVEWGAGSGVFHSQGRSLGKLRHPGKEPPPGGAEGGARPSSAPQGVLGPSPSCSS